MIVVRNQKFTAYEQDIRELLQAFFPGETLSGEDCGGAFFVLDVDDLMGQVSLSGNRFEDKTVIKRKLYELLSEKTGKELPWGTLTGIKPVRLAEKVLNGLRGVENAESTEKADSEESVESAENADSAGTRVGIESREHCGFDGAGLSGLALKVLQEKYLISGEKAELMLDIALREQELLRPLSERSGSSETPGGAFHGKGYSFYIGIPFCPTRCLYCSFTSNPVARFAERVEEYLSDLDRELKDFAAFAEKHFPGTGPSTLYIGGGTPTALNAAQLERLMDSVEKYVDTERLLEFTVEAGRPDSITREKLAVLKKHRVGRVSVNPQTMNQKTLDLIGRKHTVEQTLEAFRFAREEGFDNINMDVIMGLPGETLKEVEHTLSVIEELHPESLTVHALAVKRAARLSTDHDPWTEYERAEGYEVSAMTRMGAECASRMGMVPYYLYRQKNIAGNQENTGYAVPGTESLYNIIMMEEKQPVIGFGAGSTTKLNSTQRTENIKDLAQYLDRIEEVIHKKRTFLEEIINESGR